MRFTALVALFAATQQIKVNQKHSATPAPVKIQQDMISFARSNSTAAHKTNTDPHQEI